MQDSVVHSLRHSFKMIMHYSTYPPEQGLEEAQEKLNLPLRRIRIYDTKKNQTVMDAKPRSRPI